MKVLWYWPVLRCAQEEEGGSNRRRYANCMEAMWEPSGKRPIWIDKKTTIYSWMNVPFRGQNG